MTIVLGSLGVVEPLMTFAAGELSLRLLEPPVLYRGHAIKDRTAPPLGVGDPTLQEQAKG
jgi:hypothetical protein